VVATVPETAQEGDVTLTLANGKTVTVAYTLVKPTVTALLSGVSSQPATASVIREARPRPCVGRDLPGEVPLDR
jgi:hypothetical protein